MRVLVLLVVVLLVTWENKVNSYSNQLKLGQVCNFGVEFDNIFNGLICNRWPLKVGFLFAVLMSGTRRDYRKCLNVGLVPKFKIHKIKSVPVFKIHIEMVLIFPFPFPFLIWIFRLCKPAFKQERN